jgi:hypothetical protein
MSGHSPGGRAVLTAAGVAIVFGVLTVLSGGRILFGEALAQQGAGNVVSYVLWFNFLSGFVYVLAGVGIARRRRWATGLAFALIAGIAGIFAVFLLHIGQGGAFELRTVAAMALRLVVWILIAVVAARHAPLRQATG